MQVEILPAKGNLQRLVQVLKRCFGWARDHAANSWGLQVASVELGQKDDIRRVALAHVLRVMCNTTTLI